MVGQHPLSMSEIEYIDPRNNLLRVAHYTQKGSRVEMVGKQLQTTHRLGAVNRGNEQPGLPASDQFVIHHHSGHAAIAVHERMDLGDQEHHKQRAREWLVECLIHPEALAQRSLHELTRYEHGRAGLIVLCLKPVSYTHLIALTAIAKRFADGQGLKAEAARLRQAAQLIGADRRLLEPLFNMCKPLLYRKRLHILIV